jgi:hypothetical protein
MYTLLKVIGAFLNRIRGGLWDVPINKIYYPIFLGFITNNILVPLGAYLGQQICGWGAYIGSITTGVKPAEECKWIDWCVKKLENYPRLWGSAALAIRGLIWNACIALFYPSLSFVFVGLLMPVCYIIPTILLYKTKYNNTKAAWNIGEVLWGSLQTGALLW